MVGVGIGVCVWTGVGFLGGLGPGGYGGGVEVGAEREEVVEEEEGNQGCHPGDSAPVEARSDHSDVSQWTEVWLVWCDVVWWLVVIHVSTQRVVPSGASWTAVRIEIQRREKECMSRKEKR